VKRRRSRGSSAGDVCVVRLVLSLSVWTVAGGVDGIWLHAEMVAHDVACILRVGRSLDGVSHARWHRASPGGENPDAVLADRVHRQLGLAGHTEHAHDDDVRRHGERGLRPRTVPRAHPGQPGHFLADRRACSPSAFPYRSGRDASFRLPRPRGSGPPVAARMSGPMRREGLPFR